MTVYAVYPEVVIQERLMEIPRLLTSKLWYVYNNNKIAVIAIKLASI